MGKPWEVWKDVLYPGRVVVRQGGDYCSYTFRPADLAAACGTGNEQLAAGWHVPACWEHQDVTPVRLSRSERDEVFARTVFAHAKGFRVRGGRAEVLLAGDDPADLAQFKKVRFVSPELRWDWVDTDGRLWPGLNITHVAATPRPVQRHQEPVGGLKLSLSAHETRIFTSLPEFIGAAAGVPRVAPTIHPSLIRLSLADYAEAPTVADETETPEPEETETESGGGDWMEKVAAALKEHCGLDLGDVSAIKNPEQFAHVVEVAAKNYKAGGEPEYDEPEPEEDDEEQAGDAEQPPEGSEPPAAQPLQMSLEAQEKKAAALARQSIRREIDALEHDRQVTPATADDLRGRLKAVRLSFTAEGDVQPNEVTIRVEALRQNPKGSAYSTRGRKGRKAVRLSADAAPVADSPYRDDPPESPEKVAKTVSDWNATGRK